MLKFIGFTIIGVLLASRMVSAGQVLKPPGHLNLEEHIEEQLNPHIRILGFEIEKTSIRDIIKELGPAKLIKFEGGHHGQGRLCYISDRPSDNTLMYFNEHAISGTYLQTFEIMEQELGSNKKDCFASPKIHKNLKTDSGLGLDLSLSQLISKMGLPYRYSKAKGLEESKLIYIFIFQDSMTAEKIKKLGAEESPFFDVGLQLEFKIRRNKVFSVSISKTSTY